jgi:hypothetical protein
MNLAGDGRLALVVDRRFVLTGLLTYFYRERNQNPRAADEAGLSARYGA